MRIFLIIAGLFFVSATAYAGGASEPIDSMAAVEKVVAADKVMADSLLSTRTAFVNMPAKVLSLLTPEMRKDLLDYYDNDTLRAIPNALGGLSHLERPVTPDYLKVVITPVSTMSIRQLPHKRSAIFAVAYTITGDGNAADSEISFYDNSMRPLKTSKFLTLAQFEDFINLPKNEKDLKKELSALVPFPTVEYILSPDSNVLTARLTVEDFMGAESFARIKPYIHPEIKYHWDGKKYKLAR